MEDLDGPIPAMTGFGGRLVVVKGYQTDDCRCIPDLEDGRSSEESEVGRSRRSVWQKTMGMCAPQSYPAAVLRVEDIDPVASPSFSSLLPASLKQSSASILIHLP